MAMHLTQQAPAQGTAQLRARLEPADAALSMSSVAESGKDGSLVSSSVPDAHVLGQAEVKGPQRSCMLVLCGAPGAGKSTFSRNLLKVSSCWVRVNQDTVKGGSRGTRQQCVDLARRSLLQGQSVIIDRCNVEASQRRDFLLLAQQLGVQVHAVVLDMPATLCAEQAVARQQHEGGVEGESAARVAYSVASRLCKEGPPCKSEGISSIIVCKSHKDIAVALQVWTQQAVPVEPETLYHQKGGGRGTLQLYFAPVKGGVKVSRKTASGIPETSNGHRHWGHPGSTAPPAGKQDRLPQASRADKEANSYEAAPVTDEESMQTCLRPTEQPRPGLSPTAPTATRGGPNGKRRALEVKNAFTALMSSQAQAAALTAKRSRSSAFGPTNQELRNAALDPEREQHKHPGMLIHDQHIIINDKYPKARLHGLVIARDPNLLGPADLRRQHLPQLQSMRKVAEAWAVSEKASGLKVGEMKMGFHSLPSLHQLHLHVISQDFDSHWLKTKKHWNSFTTSFFMELGCVEREIENCGSLQIDHSKMSALLKGDLYCHKCAMRLENMPALKNHLTIHSQ